MQLKLLYLCIVNKVLIGEMDSLGPWIGKTMKLLEHKIEDLLSKEGIDLSRMQFIVLKNIEEYEGICQNDLAIFANRNKSSLTRMIGTLKKKDYIQKVPISEDKRRNSFMLTSKGKQVLASAKPHFKELIQKMEGGISEEEREVTIKVLKQIQLNVMEGKPSPFFKEKL